MQSRPIGAVVQRAMIRKGMSSAELASEVDMREDVLTKFFYGQRAIDTNELARIMDTLDLVMGSAPESAPSPASPPEAASGTNAPAPAEPTPPQPPAPEPPASS